MNARAVATSAMESRRWRALLAATVASIMVVFSAGTAGVPAPNVTSAVARQASLDPAVTEALRDATTVKVVVQLDQAALPDAVAAVRSAGGQVGTLLPIVRGFAATVTAGGIDALVATPGVRNISLDGPVTLHHSPPLGEDNGDYFYSDTVNARGLVDQGIDGSGVGIAVVDTGISPHPDLVPRIVGGVDFSGEGHPYDSFGHGTFIAGIAAGDGTASNGKFTGVAPGAHVVPVKIAGANGVTDVSHVLAAIQWTVSFKDAYDIRVLNLSVGTDSTQPRMLSPLNYAVERAWDSGIVVVVSGGNHGEEGSGRIPKPADDPLVITVGATDSEGTKPAGDDQVAAYSSRGPSIADGIVKPDIVAPGSHLVAPKSLGSVADLQHPEAHVRDDYMRGSGTSFAAGVVSGAAALLLDAHPHWTPDQVKGAITSSARPGPVGDPNVDGAGILDVGAAAALTDPAPANQGVMRGSGLGSIAQDRGSLGTATVDPLLGGLTTLTGELTSQGLLFDAVEYTTSEWSGSDWYGSDWYGSDWYGSDWYGSDWYGSDWYGSDWYWYGSDWYGSDWYGSDWYGSDWYGSDWYGSDWYGSDWYGSDWYGSDWYGSDWYGSDWYLDDWS